MRKGLKNTFLLFFLVISVKAFADSCCNTGCDYNQLSQNLWQPHAFSNYALQELLIMKNLDISGIERNWLNRFGFVTEYMQSFDHSCHGLGSLPFWSGTNKMTIGTNNGESDLDAYQFGMGDVIETGSITLLPEVQHMGTELMWYGMQNHHKAGVYVKVKVPLGAMSITSKACENPAELSDQNITGYVWPVQRFTTLTEALQGGFFSNDPIYNYGLLAACKKTVIRFGDITFALGCNVIADENKLVGFGLKVSGPTGNVPRATYMLEPIFGRAGLWGLGAEIMGYYNWSGYNAHADAVRVWWQGEIMHLFSGRTPSWRSFDLAANGPGSRYLLLQHYSLNNETGIGFIPDIVVPAINTTTFPVKSSFAVEGNFAVSVDIMKNNWNVAIAGEVWGRSRESLSLPCCALDAWDEALPGLNLNQLFHYRLNNYAVLGRQTPNIAKLADPKPTWCEPLARINKSQDAYDGVGQVPQGIADGALAQNRIPAEPHIALDVCGAQAPSIVTGKILLEVGYTFKENAHVPRVSVFGGVECSGTQKQWPYLWSAGLQSSVQF